VKAPSTNSRPTPGASVLGALVLFVALLGGTAVLCGCEKNAASNDTRVAAETTPNQPKTAPGTKTSANRQFSSVERSQLRERAFAVLNAAGNGTAAEGRANAIEAMIDSPKRLEPLARRGLLDTNLGVRAVAATAVGKARLNNLVDMVRPLTADTSPMVRIAATYALAQCGQNPNVEALAQLLRDPSPLVRAQTAYVLGEMGNKSADLMLRDASRDSMPMADPGAVRLMRLQLCEAMVKLGNRDAVEEIRAALYPSRPEDLEATVLAIQIVGQVNDEPSAWRLKCLALDSDPQRGMMPPEVRLAAAAVLAKIGRPKGDGAFMADAYYQSPEAPLRAQSAAVYGATGRAATLPNLEVLMADQDSLVKVAAAAAIVKVTGGLD